MDLKLTARHDGVTQADKDYAQEKVLHLKRYLDRMHDAEMVFDKQGDKVRVHLQIGAAKGQTLVAQVDQNTPQEAVDAVVNKMETQLTKFKEKLKNKDRKSSGRLKALRLQELATPPVDDEPTYREEVDKAEIPDPDKL